MMDGLKLLPTATDPPLDLDNVRIDPAWSLRVPASLALRRRVLPLCRLGDAVAVACVNADDSVTFQHVRKYLECDVIPVIAENESLRKALVRVYGGVSMPGAAESSPVRYRVRDARSPESDDAVAICDELLQAALLRDASDIHLLPTDSMLQVLMRVDGKLEVYRELPPEFQNAVTNRLKVLAGLDIAEKRAPQDGRFTSRIGPAQRKIDIRTATLPTRFGERVTLRLLAAQGTDHSLSSLGMNAPDLSAFRRSIARPHGLILLTGPTGSGKSTTLYAAIKEMLETRGGNVITVEDPIEYEIRGVSQVEVDTADKVNFGKALRSILRHDPDVVMIGEIRDAETADIAVKASLTGHLVFSTLHTNSAVSVVTRLLDMGVDHYLVAAVLRLAVAQRLVRRLCPHCRAESRVSPEDSLALGKPELEGELCYVPRGCVYCAGRGYAGRVALFELVESDPQLARLIADRHAEDDLLRHVMDKRTPLLIDDAISKVKSGVTTLSEILSAVVSW